jgi:hypothetical protein
MNNTNLALKYQETKNLIGEIQKTDRNLLRDLVLVATPGETIELMKYFESQKTVAGANIAQLNQNKATLHSILEKRIALTAEVLNIRQGLIIPTPDDVKIVNSIKNNVIDPDLQDQPIEERQTKQEVTLTKAEATSVNPKGKTVDATKKFVKAAEKDTKAQSPIITVTPKDQWFKGYERQTVFGSLIDLPQAVQILLQANPSDLDKIDEIAKILIDNNMAENALNLSIDLAVKSKLLDQTAVEQRFLFKVLPNRIGTICEPKDDMEEISLSMWIDQLKAKLDPNYLESKGITSIVSPDSITQQDKTAFNNEGTPGLTASGTGLTVSTNKPVETIEEEIVPTTSVEGLTKDSLFAECIQMLKDGKQKDAYPHFIKSIKDVTDITDDQKNVFKPLWKDLMTHWGNISKATTEVSGEPVNIVNEPATDEIVIDKDALVEAAHEAAIEGKETLTEDIVKEKVKSIILESLKTKSTNAMNEVRKFLKPLSVRKLLGGKQAGEYFKSVKEEVITENPEIEVDNALFRPLTKSIDLATSKEYADVYESIIQCKTNVEFESLISSILFEKKDLIKDAWAVAYNATLQHLNTFDLYKEMDDSSKTIWFKAFHEKEKKARLQNIKEVKPVVENTEVSTEVLSTEPIKIEEVSETTPQEIIEESRTNDKVTNFSAIAKETKSNRVKELAVEALKAGISEEELAKLIKQSKPYKGTRPDDMVNIINKLKVIAEIKTK